MTPQQTQILTAAKGLDRHAIPASSQRQTPRVRLPRVYTGGYGVILSETSQNPRLPTRPIGRNGGARELLWNAALRHLTPIKPINPNHTGDIILLRMMQSASAKHLAVLAGAQSAQGGFPNHYPRIQRGWRS